MASEKKPSVFGAGSSSRSMPRRSRVVWLGPRGARCACGSRESLLWLLTGKVTVLGPGGVPEERTMGEWKCPDCRQGSLF